MDKQSISCASLDNLEVACLYHYRLRVVLVGGHQFDGVAEDLTRNSSAEECLQMDVDKQILDVALYRIDRVIALT